MRSGGTLMLLRTGGSESALVSRGVTWGFLPAFWVLAWSFALNTQFTAGYATHPNA